MIIPDVYLYDHSGDSRTLDDLKALLGEERYEYCNKMKNIKAGLCSAYAFLLLRYALRKEYGIIKIPKLTYNDYGKPFLKDHPGISFNMSHIRSCSICAVSDRSIGVDIQDIRKLSIRTARKFLTQEELDAVSEIDDPDKINDELCRLWCIKESIGKCRGKGFGEGFTSICANDLINSGAVRYTKKHDYYISVCVTEQE